MRTIVPERIQKHLQFTQPKATHRPQKTKGQPYEMASLLQLKKKLSSHGHAGACAPSMFAISKSQIPREE
jgi:hypothetical protein